MDPAKETKELVVVEGFFDAFHIHQVSFGNVVALMGSQLYPAQQSQIEAALGPGGKITLIMDMDEAGANCERRCIEALTSTLYERAIRLPDGAAQPDELTGEQIKKLLTS